MNPLPPLPNPANRHEHWHKNGKTEKGDKQMKATIKIIKGNLPQVQRLVVLATILFFPFFLASCATTANYRNLVESYVGAHIDDLTAKWGYPTREFTAPNGNRVVAYELAQNRRTPVYTTPATTHTSYQYYANSSQSVTIPGVQMGGNQYVAWCNTYFELDDSDVIIDWKHQGNACVY